MNAESRKKCFQIRGGHVLRINFDVQDSGVGGNFIGAGEMRRSVSNFQCGRLKDTGVFPQIVLGIEFDVHGSGSGGAPGNEQGLGKFGGAAEMRFTVLSSDSGMDIKQPAETGRRINKSSGCEIQTLNVELGVHRRKRGVLLIERANGTVEL